MRLSTLSGFTVPQDGVSIREKVWVPSGSLFLGVCCCCFFVFIFFPFKQKSIIIVGSLPEAEVDTHDVIDLAATRGAKILSCESTGISNSKL